MLVLNTTNRSYSRFIYLVLACLIVAGISTQKSWATNNEAVAAVLKQYFDGSVIKAFPPSVEKNIEPVQSYYESRNFKPVWTRDTGPKGKGKALFQELKRSNVHGLSPNFYGVSYMAPLMTQTKPDDLATLDLLMTAAFFEYAHDLRNGRLGFSSPFDGNQVPPITFQANDLISDAADSGNLRNLASEFLGTDDRYIRLISKYVEFQRISKSGLWPEVSADGQPINKGDKDKRMVDIRELLMLTGDLPAVFVDGSDYHDSHSTNAVSSYQRRHGLEVSGRIDPVTLAAMAVSIEGRMDQLLTNLERRRWQNQELDGNHLYLNLADGSARLVVDGKRVGFLEFDINQTLQQVPTVFGKVLGLTNNDGQTSLEFSYQSREGTSHTTTLPLAFDTQKHALELLSPIMKQDGNTFNAPLAIYVTYLTAWANKDGSVNFRPDIFERDPTVSKLLKAN
jgi:murein L,D-transpeptidase YcbB/YkuD